MYNGRTNGRWHSDDAAREGAAINTFGIALVQEGKRTRRTAREPGATIAFQQSADLSHGLVHMVHEPLLLA
jgi:hypothetical protein